MKTLASLALLGLLTLAAPVRAAESYDNCTGFIDALPATISTQGAWCMRKDLATALTSGAAITVATSNVTIDCNDFKLGGLPAGTATDTRGIKAVARANILVRGCNIRGFFVGVDLDGASHVVEDNNLNGNLSTGIRVLGNGSIIRRNAVLDTGGSTQVGQTGLAIGIYTVNNVDVLDNTIDGVLAAANPSGDKSGYGIVTIQNAAGTIAGNRIRGVIAAGSGDHYGISNSSDGRISIVDNVLSGSGQPNGWGISCNVSGQGTAMRNVVNGFTTGITGCTNSGGNVQIP